MNGMSPIPADMSDSVKQKRLIHCPLFLWGGVICRASAINNSCYTFTVENGS
jgi:hypothetical protein